MSNDDNLKVRQTDSKKKSFKELTIIRDTIFWIDVVGEGQNVGLMLLVKVKMKMQFLQDHLMIKKLFLRN